jgi:peptidoglycan/LPS O-acetylase OafA/YrhL
LYKDSYKPTYFRELNSLRFIGFIGIFFGHVFFNHNIELISSRFYIILQKYGKILGFVSLDSFFVLSSFLITWKALEELQFSKNFNLKYFLIRRSLRIWPLYFLVVFLGFMTIYISYYFNEVTNELPSFYSFLFFILNYDIIKNGYEFLFFMVFLWSISVEEQFYVFWALVLKWFNKKLLAISIILIISSLMFRCFYLKETLHLNFNTLSTLGNFGIGAIIALFAFKKNKLYRIVKDLSSVQILLIYLIMAVVFIAAPKLLEFDLFIIFQRLIFSIFFAFIILEQSYCDNSILKFSRIRFFDFFGKISFGLYCYHGIVITIILNFNYNDSLVFNILVYPILIFILTLLVSYVSYRFYETKFLKLKSKFSLSN